MKTTFNTAYRLTEVTLTVVAAVLAGWQMWRWWGYLHSAASSGHFYRRGLWPFPAGYLVEVCFLAVGALAVLLLAHRGNDRWLRGYWVIVGALAALAVLGAWSVGGSVAPTTVLLAAAGAVAALRTRTPLLPLLGSFAVGLGGQSILMLLVVAVRVAGA